MARSHRIGYSPPCLEQALQAWIGTSITLGVAFLFIVASGAMMAQRTFATTLRAGSAPARPAAPRRTPRRALRR